MYFNDIENLPAILARRFYLCLVGCALGFGVGPVSAALPGDAVLSFVSGVTSCTGGSGTPPNCSIGQEVTAGSFFGIDFNGDGTVDPNERTAISQNEGLVLGSSQPAGGSHPGPPDGSETPSIDKPWEFFANTGMTQTTAPVTIVGGDNGAGDGQATLGFSGLGITWNGIPNIPLGGDPTNFPGDTGAASMNCSAECDIGDSYTLDYAAHVPLGDPSGFGGVFYVLHLEGSVEASVDVPPTRGISLLVGGGALQECAMPGGSEVTAEVQVNTSDPADVASIEWSVDGAPAGSGPALTAFLELGDHEIGVMVNTVNSGVFEQSQAVTVRDTTAPSLEILFVDKASGMPVTEVEGRRRHLVTVRYDATDICDPEPQVSGAAVPVHAVEDGDMIVINHGRFDTVRLNTSAIEVTATARDAAGNQTTQSATLLTGE